VISQVDKTQERRGRERKKEGEKERENNTKVQ